MKIISIKKYILVFVSLSCALITDQVSAVGLATGPSLGIAGFRTTFDATGSSKKIHTNNFAFQIGGFAKLDVWLLYTKLDFSFVLDWHKLPNQSDIDHFEYITLPMTIGMPCFGLLRPHIGLIFRIPLSGLDDLKFKKNNLIKSYSKKINGYIVGIGIDLGSFLIDIYSEFACSTIERKSISTDLIDGLKKHTPKQLALKLSYNLLG